MECDKDEPIVLQDSYVSQIPFHRNQRHVICFKKWRFFYKVSAAHYVSQRNGILARTFFIRLKNGVFFKRNKNGVIKMALTIRKLYYTI